MRRLLLLSMLLSTVYSVSAADSVITVKGQLKDNMCSVSVGSQDFTVDLQTYATSAFRSVGSSSNAVPFSITLENCGSAASAVKINITGTTDSTNSTLLKNTTAPGSATGIGVQILNADKVIIQPNQSSSSLSSTNLTANQTNIISYYAQMVSTSGTVVAGTVSSTANFTLQFN
ncbi:fimbrial protein [Rosenbergiella collisarenosi]|uniref:fimbrial protein n=1 Tax=Rosenbergiella collisarenosi TaxID=1544695 RepID=UPI001F4F711F|nr:fimbrial protein [Rosenbergiella collisarenosi]